MKSYETIRKGRIVLASGSPIGGKFSYDADNRKKLPKDVEVPKVVKIAVDKIDEDVAALVNKTFKNHPGQLDDLWIPTTRKAKNVEYLNYKLRLWHCQDALKADDSFLFTAL